MNRQLVTLVAVLVLAGCATNRQTTFPPPEQMPNPPGTQQPGAQQPGAMSPPGGTQQPRQTKLPPRTAAEASSPAVRSLLGRADTLARNGNMDLSAATLERALDLEPRNPFVYQRLAAVRLAQGQTGQAEAMARKSNSVAGNNPFVRSDNWRLIAEARRTAGDRSGADEATNRADNYRKISLQMTQ